MSAKGHIKYITNRIFLQKHNTSTRATAINFMVFVSKVHILFGGRRNSSKRERGHRSPALLMSPGWRVGGRPSQNKHLGEKSVLMEGNIPRRWLPRHAAHQFFPLNKLLLFALSPAALYSHHIDLCETRLWGTKLVDLCWCYTAEATLVYMQRWYSKTTLTIHEKAFRIKLQHFHTIDFIMIIYAAKLLHK